jgi:hypothetical protein
LTLAYLKQGGVTSCWARTVDRERTFGGLLNYLLFGVAVPGFVLTVGCGLFPNFFPLPLSELQGKFGREGWL